MDLWGITELGYFTRVTAVPNYYALFEGAYSPSIRPAQNEAWGSLTGTISSQQDLMDFVASQVSNKANNSDLTAVVNSVNANGTAITARLLKSANLSDLTDTVQARTNLDVYSKEEIQAVITAAENVRPTTTGPSGQITAGTASPHQYWRILITANTGANWGSTITKLELRSAIGVSQEATGGVAFGSASNGSSTPDRAFDTDINSNWQSTTSPTPAAPVYVGYNFGAGNKRAVNQVAITTYNGDYQANESPTNFSVQFSDDGTNWTTSYIVSGATYTGNAQTSAFTDPNYGQPTTITQWYPTMLTALNDVSLSETGLADGYVLTWSSADQKWEAKASGFSATIAANTVLGNNTAGSAAPTALTAAQLAAMLPVFTNTAKGLVPASGGNASAFLRGDGGFAVPTLAGLAEVNLTTPATDGQVLLYNNATSKWIPAALPSGVTTLAALNDVGVGSQTNGMALTWNSGTSKWVPTNITGALLTGFSSSNSTGVLATDTVLQAINKLNYRAFTYASANYYSTSGGTISGNVAITNGNSYLIYDSVGGQAGFTYDGTNSFKFFVSNNTGAAVNVFTIAGRVAAPIVSYVIPIKTVAPTASAAGLNLPHGTAPTAPTNGDLWTTTAGLYAQINGATVGPLGTGSSGGGGSSSSPVKPWYWNPPLAANFSTIYASFRGGTAAGVVVADDPNVGMTYTDTSADTTFIKPIGRPIPAANQGVGKTFTVTAHLKANSMNANDQIGIWVRANANQYIFFGLFNRNGSVSLQRAYYNSAWNDGNYSQTWESMEVWVRIAVSNQTTTYYLSADGKIWNQVYPGENLFSAAFTDYGVYTSRYTSSTQYSVSVDSLISDEFPLTAVSGPFTGGSGTPSTPTVRSSNIVSANTGSFVIPFPTGTVAGDLVVLFGENGVLFNQPSGWTQVDNSQGTNCNGAVFAKIMTAADITTGSVTVTVQSAWNGVIAAVTIIGSTVSGIRSPVTTVRSTNGAASQALTSFVLLPTDLVLAFGGTRGACDVTFSSGFTSLQAVNAANASGAVAKFTGTGSKVGIAETCLFSVAGTGYYTALMGFYS